MTEHDGAALPALTPRRERLFLLTLAAVQFSHIVDYIVIMPLGPFLIQGLGIDTKQFGLLVASYSFCAAGVPACSPPASSTAMAATAVCCQPKH